MNDIHPDWNSVELGGFGGPNKRTVHFCFSCTHAIGDHTAKGVCCTGEPCPALVENTQNIAPKWPLSWDFSWYKK